MEVLRLESPEALAEGAAAFITACALHAIEQRGQFILALSGGSTPWRMLSRLAGQDLPWSQVHIVQVDERFAPAGDSARNLTHINSQFDAVPVNLHAMPVNQDSPEIAARQYADTLAQLAGSPPVLDLVHLGLGNDGHTASLLPGDELLQNQRTDVGFTGPYQGHVRMSLTYPIINRARHILWLISGTDKRVMLERLISGDREIPAGAISTGQTSIFTDVPE